MVIKLRLALIFGQLSDLIAFAVNYGMTLKFYWRECFIELDVKTSECFSVKSEGQARCHSRNDKILYITCE